VAGGIRFVNPAGRSARINVCHCESLRDEAILANLIFSRLLIVDCHGLLRTPRNDIQRNHSSGNSESLREWRGGFETIALTFVGIIERGL